MYEECPATGTPDATPTRKSIRILTSSRLWQAAVPLWIRLLGVGVSGSKAAGQRQQTLFPDAGREARRRLLQVVDRVREQFGREVLERSSALDRNE
jgi:hypothetical protein